MSQSKEAKVDLAAAVEALRGQSIGPFETDALALDAEGRIAIFFGSGDRPVASMGALRSASEVMERLFARATERQQPVAGNAYRETCGRPPEIVYDTPRETPDRGLHERPTSGYPQLVVASDLGAQDVRQALETWGGHEVLTREGFAVVLDVVGAITFDELHASAACRGCRNLDDPADPKVRSPRVLALAGLYVYGEGADGSWLRIATPGVAADADDLTGARLLALPDVSFEEAAWLPGAVLT